MPILKALSQGAAAAGLIMTVGGLVMRRPGWILVGVAVIGAAWVGLLLAMASEEPYTTQTWRDRP